MITLEGMTMAKPIIATRIQGIEEQITNGETCILVPSCDSNGLARAIVNLLDNRQFAETLGLNAREKVERDFSVDKMVSETERIFQLLSDHHEIHRKSSIFQRKGDISIFGVSYDFFRHTVIFYPMIFGDRTQMKAMNYERYCSYIV